MALNRARGVVRHNGRIFHYTGIENSVHVTTQSAIRMLSGSEIHARCSELADILIACVQGGASVSFMAPLTRETAEGFWHSVAESVHSGDRMLLVAEDCGTQRLVGTVQLLLKQP